MFRSSVILFFILSVLTGYVSGQADDKFRDDPKLKKMLEKGIELKKRGKVSRALQQFDKILKRSDEYIPARLQKAMIFYENSAYLKAITELEAVMEIDETYDASIFYSLGHLYEKVDQKQNAVIAYRSYVNSVKVESPNYNKAQHSIERLEFVLDKMKNPVPFEPVDPGEAINTENHEYLATVDITGKMMVFTRRVNRQEDLYQSIKVNGAWTKAIPLEGINTPFNEAAHALSADGKTLYFTKCENRFTYGSCDIFVSENVEGQWTGPENLGTSVNAGSWDSQPAISADGRRLYFTSSRPGGYGGRDIWYCEKDRKGQWSEARNAGERINTSGNEESPFIHPDGVHMYFMSDGHQGMGGYDLFVSVNSGENWSSPENLGFPINTEKDEGAIRVAPDGKTAFFASDRTDIAGSGKQDLDIYSFQLYDKITSLPVGYVEGVILDKVDLQPVITDITVLDNLSGEWIRDVRTDDEGKFKLTLTPGFHYNVRIEHPEYIFHTESFNLVNAGTRNEPVRLKVLLVPLKVEGKAELSDELVLKNVFFESGSAKLDTQMSKPELDLLFDFLYDNPSFRIQIEGHTDNIGKVLDNQYLSEQRAKSVMDFLLEKGIVAERLKAVGFGESKPIDTNETPEGRQNNRRTSFKILQR